MSVSYGPNLGKMINAGTGDAFDIDFRAFLRMIDALLQGSVKSQSLSAPPSSPANGDRYIIGASPSGAWAGAAGSIACWTTDDPAATAGEWNVYAPKVGWLVYSVADAGFFSWTGSAWAALLAGGSSGVASLNSLTGGLSIAEGSGITVTVAGSTITIAASGGGGGGATAFTGLSDVPSAYTGAGGKAVEVNSGATALVFSAKPFDVGVTAPGVGANNQILLRLKLARAVTFPSGAALSLAAASAAATASTTFTLKKNGTSFATVNFAASSASGVWTQASDAAFSPGDLLEIDGPATADATLADVGITLAGTRA